jgi:molybdenum cofactor guanylyltransferase
MGGRDKGLETLGGRPMIEYVIEALAPQVGNILVSANRNLERYGRYGYCVVTDDTGDYPGPLAGIAAGLQAVPDDRMLTLPCDSPFVPAGLARRLDTALNDCSADIAVATDGHRLHLMFAMIRRRLLADLLAYLDGGGRKVEDWYNAHRLAVVDFSDCPDAFLNVNTVEDKVSAQLRLANDVHPPR